MLMVTPQQAGRRPLGATWTLGGSTCARSDSESEAANHPGPSMWTWVEGNSAALQMPGPALSSSVALPGPDPPYAGLTEPFDGSERSHKRGIPNLNVSRPLFPEGDVSIENHLVLRLPTPSSRIVDPHSPTAQPQSLPLAPNPRVLLRVLVWLHKLRDTGTVTSNAVTVTVTRNLS
jgi:hypothetical protein